MVKWHELAIGSSFLVSGQIIQAIIGFAVNLVLVRYLAPEEFGRFAIVLAGTALVFSVFSLRVEAMIIRARKEQLTETAIDRYFGASVVETVFAILVLYLWMVVTDTDGKWQISLVLALGFRHWVHQNKSFFERTMPYRELALTETLVSISSHLLALVLILSGVGWVVLFIREIFLTLAGFCGLWLIGGLTIRRFRFPSLDDWRHLFGEARGIWLDAVLENGLNRLTILFVGYLGGDRAAGFFFQALRLASLPQQVLAPIVGRVAGNWFSRTENRRDRRRGRDKLLLVLFVPLFLAAGLTVLFADPVVIWMFGDAWARTADLMIGLSGFILFLTLFEILKSYCWTARQVRWLLVGRIAQYAGCAVPVYLAMVGYMTGDMALAIGQSLAYGLAFIVVLAILKKIEDY
ncbi:MAG: oligosaccharide flippase family protein [Rhodospirillales bacterium]|nr:oligosaccharide flippase family protein [Rhodospirillales bacterium]